MRSHYPKGYLSSPNLIVKYHFLITINELNRGTFSSQANFILGDCKVPIRQHSRPVVLAVSSGGGHWVQMQRLTPAFESADLHFATTDASAANLFPSARIHTYPDANKDTPLRVFACVLRMAWIVLSIRPDVVISTGAAGGYLAIRLARLTGARTMFIDSIANARKLSISARLSMGVADRVLSQWPEVAHSTGAEYRGAVI